MIMRRWKYPGTKGLILRRIFDELYKSHIVPLFEEFPEMRPWYNASHKELRFPNRSILYFGSAEHDADMATFYGSEYADILPDEAEEFSENELNKLRGSLRAVNSAITPKMVYTFMPGVGKGLSYLKRMFIDRDIPEDQKHRWAFVQAFSWDNIKWAEKELARDGITAEEYYSWPDQKRRDYFITSTAYGQNLASISDEYLRDAWLYGKWNVFEGQVFPELSDRLHNLDHFAPPTWRPPIARLVSAVDWADSGVTGGEQAAIDPEENIFAIGEYHERNKTVLEHAANLTAMLNEFGKQDYTLMDLPVNNINQHNLFSIQDAFRRAGLHTIQAHRANIAIGLDLLKQMLKVDPNRVHPFTSEIGSPRLFISRTRCPELWKQMSELQQTVDADTGKVKYIGEDDNLDPLRYIAMSRPTSPARPKLVPQVLPQFTFERKVAGAMAKFDAKFGKDPSENDWMGHIS